MDASLGGRFPRTIVYKRTNTFSLTDSGLQNNTLMDWAVFLFYAVVA